MIGEKRANTKNTGDNALNEINIPLMKIKGNLIKVLRVMMFEVMSVGGAAISTPREELAQDNNIVPKINQINTENDIFRASNNTIQTMDEIIILNSEDARIILVTKSNNVTGAERIRSRFFSRVSHGKTTGLIAVLIKNTAIPKTPQKIWTGSMVRPTIQANAIKKGNSKPKMITGPFLKYKSKFFFVNIQICSIFKPKCVFILPIFTCLPIFLKKFLQVKPVKSEFV